MPKISLKPNSPEFQDCKRRSKFQDCESPGCPSMAEHRAPKHRGLNDYYNFCLDHVKEYNKSWDYFSGMQADEIEEQIFNSLYGDRPTWRYDFEGMTTAYIRKKAWQSYHFTEKDPESEAEQQDRNASHNRNTPEFEALAIMGLETPITLTDIKARYKALVKKHHPDINPGCETSEDLLKRINMAYTILKIAYEQFEELPQNKT